MTCSLSGKYPPLPQVQLASRRWPTQQITDSPQWCSVDLHDGNNALIEPMGISEKFRLWDLLIKVGFKQIEVGAPGSSRADFNFIRELIESNRIPQDVAIQVQVEPYAPQIAQTFLALNGAHKVILQLSTPTSPAQRMHGLGPQFEDIHDTVIQGARRLRAKASQYPHVQWSFAYSAENYASMEPEEVVDICNAVLNEWVSTNYPLTINLPATVERCSPNQFADQIEWFCNHIQYRNQFTLSVHTHNDRGCAVAAAEMALLAGAERVEGSLLGNGERSGNMDIVTLAMNLHSQGVDSQLDLSNINDVVNVVSECTHLPVHPRHPYAGELAFSTAAGEQEAVLSSILYRQGEPASPWKVPYLPIDPADIGRSYSKISQVNPYSGRGGVSSVLEQFFGLELPRWLQDSFAQLVQHYTDELDVEFTTENLIELFRETYLVKDHYHINQVCISHEGHTQLQITFTTPDGLMTLTGQGKGTLVALKDAWECWSGLSIDIVAYDEHTTSTDGDGQYAAYVRLRSSGCTVGGMALGEDSMTTALQAFIAAATQGEFVAASA